MSTLWTPKLSTLPSVNLRIVDDSDTFDMKALQEALLSSPRVLSVSDTRCPNPPSFAPWMYLLQSHERAFEFCVKPLSLEPEGLCAVDLI